MDSGTGPIFVHIGLTLLDFSSSIVLMYIGFSSIALMYIGLDFAGDGRLFS